ncbi:MAG: acetate kinase [Candidatus Eremiobacteraeota bacterium]|nr:acetate kinase [Candidatus Eremiobacteraeota bacterium]
MKVLVVNSGSSSLKFQLIETSLEHIEADSDHCLARGIVERIGGQALINFEAEGQSPTRGAAPIRDHKQAVERVLQWFLNESKLLGSAADIGGVGHRVVHGGEKFQRSVALSQEVLAEIEDCIPLAPLHNPANLKGIRATQELLGSSVPQVAVFDTAFHASMPPAAYLYGVPYSMYRRHQIRRYGFHGTSHRYIAYRYRTQQKVGKDQVNIISLHLGNGCSACAIKNGQSINTSMGMTPVEGLLMGTRCGDLDPSVVEILMQNEGLNVHEVDSLLNKQSGLLGISGLTGDMRDLLLERRENGDRRASLAIEMFCQRVRRYIGAYLAEMGGAQAIVFTGGIGQNAGEVRAEICQGLGWFGVELDEQANQNIQGDQGGPITRPDCRLPVYVIPTNEELLIARDTVRSILQG